MNHFSVSKQIHQQPTQKLELREQATAHGKTWTIHLQSEAGAHAGKLLAKGKALHRLFEEATRQQELSSPYQELTSCIAFREFASEQIASRRLSDVLPKCTGDYYIGYSKIRAGNLDVEIYTPIR